MLESSVGRIKKMFCKVHCISKRTVKDCSKKSIINCKLQVLIDYSVVERSFSLQQMLWLTKGIKAATVNCKIKIIVYRLFALQKIAAFAPDKYSPFIQDSAPLE